MLKRALNFFENLRSSLWFVPLTLVLSAILLASFTLYVDEHRSGLPFSLSKLIFTTGQEGARDFLSVLAGSLIGVISIAFTGTIIALQQGGAQYTERILRHFVRDRVNQIVLGSNFATFLYCILVLREIRGHQDIQEPFRPEVSVTVAVFMAVISLALLVYFIHHVAQQFKISTILNDIRSTLDPLLGDQLRFPLRGPDNEMSYEDAVKTTEHLRVGHEIEIDAAKEGYIRQIDWLAITKALRDCEPSLVLLTCQIGDYIYRGEVLFHIWSRKPLTDKHVRDMKQIMILARERSQLDIAYLFRQMTGVTIKLLTQDPMTSIECISSLAGALALLRGRRLPSALSTEPFPIVHKEITYEQLVNENIGPIHAVLKKQSPYLTSYLIRHLQKLMHFEHEPNHRAVLRRLYCAIQPPSTTKG